MFSLSVVRGLPGHPELLLVPAVLEFPDTPGIHFPDTPGIHLVSNVVDVAPEDVSIGMAVDVTFVDIADGWKLPVFRPA